MPKTSVNPTRVELSKLKKKLTTATRGHKLLKDKRDELMRQFLELVKENKSLREKVEIKLKTANKNFALANAVMSTEALNTALLAPKQELYINTSYKNVMSVDIPVFDIKTRTPDKNDIFSYGFAFTSPDLDTAVQSLYNILPDLVRLAQIEKSCQLMSDEIEKTRRRVNALEYVVIPDAKEKIRYITRKLDENERSNQTRLIKIKDITIKRN